MHFVKNLGDLPLTEAAADVKIRRLNEKVDEILVAVQKGQNTAEAVRRTIVELSAAEQREVAALIVDRLLYFIPEMDYEAHVTGPNTVLLECIGHLNTAGMDMFKRLEPYSRRIHQIPGIKNGKGELTADWARQHLLHVGRIIYACNLKDYKADHGHGSYSGGEIKHQ